MRRLTVRGALARWVPVAIGLSVLVGCAAVPLSTTATSPSSDSPAPVAHPAAAAVAAGTPSKTKGAESEHHRILILGASYTQGLGAEPATAGYAYLVGPELHWASEVHGVSGTGYLNPGPRHQGTFAQQIDQLPTTFAPNVVLVQGGRNDGNYPRPRLEAAIAATIAQARKHFVGARIVMLGPIPPRVPVDAGELRAEAALGAVAASQHVMFIDPIREHWITAENQATYAGHVPGHPNNAGYAYIAHRLALDLSRMPAPPTHAPTA